MVFSLFHFLVFILPLEPLEDWFYSKTSGFFCFKASLLVKLMGVFNLFERKHIKTIGVSTCLSEHIIKQLVFQLFGN